MILLTAAAAGTVLYLRGVHRFRDPVRFSAPQAGSVLSPADGVVALVRRIDMGRVENYGQSLSDLLDAPTPKQDGWLIGVLISPLDVHYTYQPTGGLVVHTHYRTGTNTGLGWARLLPIAARQPVDLLDAPGTASNERYSYTLLGDQGSITVTQIGLGRPLQPTTYLREGDDARAGNKATFLPEGGLVLLHLPDSLLPQVQVGQRVVGAETVLASPV